VNSPTNIWASVIDYETNISRVLVEVTDPNGLKYNFSMNYFSGNNSRGNVSLWVKNYVPAVVGAYYLRFYVFDDFNNSFDTGPFYLNFTSISISGGGGGSREVIVNTTTIPVYETIQVCNNNNVCEPERGENFWNCNSDCHFDISYITCDNPSITCLWKTNWFAIFLLGVIIVSLIFLYGKPKKKKKVEEVEK
ncbi:MAG: hypothetical protein QXU20_05045, partial [Candidatus Woesearchaeota archaeon]